MSRRKLLGGLSIIFESEDDSSDRDSVIKSSTYLFEKSAIENIEVKITKQDGSCIYLNVEDWETFVDEEYFEEEMGEE